MHAVSRPSSPVRSGGPWLARSTQTSAAVSTRAPMGMPGPVSPADSRAVEALVMGADVRRQVGEGTDPGQDVAEHRRGAAGPVQRARLLLPGRLAVALVSSPACSSRRYGTAILPRLWTSPARRRRSCSAPESPRWEAARRPGWRPGASGTAPRGLQVGEVGQRLAHGQAPVAGQLVDRFLAHRRARR